eukprot:1821593-Rhodomonas_salina.1
MAQTPPGRQHHRLHQYRTPHSKCVGTWHDTLGQYRTSRRRIAWHTCVPQFGSPFRVPSTNEICCRLIRQISTTHRIA